MNKLKLLVSMVIRGNYLDHDHYFYFKHEDIRQLAQDARDKFGLDFFRGEQVQELCFKALSAVASNGAQLQRFYTEIEPHIMKLLKNDRYCKLKDRIFFRKYDKDPDIDITN